MLGHIFIPFDMLGASVYCS